jgi:DNA-directed RNA polymerase subunit RPC12/RpoP
MNNKAVKIPSYEELTQGKQEYKCHGCGKTEQAPTLPYQWSSIHEEAAGVHDSDCVTYKYDYFLCPDCRIKEFDNGR